MTATETFQTNLRQLTTEEVERFKTDGCLLVRNVFPAELTEKVVPEVCSELKLDMNNPATWPKHLVALQKVLQNKKTTELPDNWRKFTPVVVLRKELDPELLDEIYTARYNGVIDDLCGHGRWQMRKGIGHWPILFPLFKGQTWQPIEGGWHLDGDFEHMSLTSCKWGLILMHLFTDIQPGGGGTAVRPGSHHYTARILAEAGPDGLERDELIRRLMHATQHLPVKEITGNNGDLVIMHPWVVHSSSLNTGDQFRIAANKHIALHAPMNFNRAKPSELSPVELTVAEAIGGNDIPLDSVNNNGNGLNGTASKKNESLFQKARRLRYINARDFVRISVLCSNPYWPFSKLNQQPYHHAISSFTDQCSKYSEIKSVYLRRSLKEGNWTPGLSDIDLTVISKAGFETQKEFDFLNSFWAKYNNLKKFHPMIGEVYIIREVDFNLWRKLELEGINTHNWELIHGTDFPRGRAPVVNDIQSLENFNHAFSFYLNYFLKLFNSKSFSSHLIAFDLFRLKRKISKCLTRTPNSPNASNGKVLKSQLPDKTEMLCDVIEQLRKGLAEQPKTPPAGDEKWQNNIEKYNNLLVDEKAIDLTKLQKWHDHIQCVYLNFSKKVFIILKDGLDKQTFTHCVKDIAAAFSNEKRLPVILNVNLFRYFIRIYKPFEYGHFVNYRILSFGTDILPDIAPPDKSDIVKQLVKEASEVLKFPYSQKFFTSFGKRHSTIEFQHIFDLILMIKFYLENDRVSPWYQEFRDNSYNAYPEPVKKMNELKAQSVESNNHTLDFQWFTYYKQMADEIRALLLTEKTFNQSNEI